MDITNAPRPRRGGVLLLRDATGTGASPDTSGRGSPPPGNVAASRRDASKR